MLRTRVEMLFYKKKKNGPIKMQHTKIKCVPNPFRIRFCCNTRGSGSITKRPPGKIHLKCYIAHSVLLLKTIS